MSNRTEESSTDEEIDSIMKEVESMAPEEKIEFLCELYFKAGFKSAEDGQTWERAKAGQPLKFKFEAFSD